YDQVGRRTKSIDPLLNVTYFDWSPRGDLEATVDALGTETAYTYNGLRLMTRQTVTDSKNAVLADDRHGYDIYKNRIQTLTGLGNATYFFYDVADQLTATKDALQNQAYFTYDAVGNATILTDPRNNSAYFYYDLLSRVTAARDALGNASYFFYDLADNRTHAV